MEFVPEASLRVGLMTREYPPLVYGGAGVHVEYLSRELAKSIEVEVHCWGDQFSDKGNLHVRGAEPWSKITDGTQEKFKAALEAFSLNLAQITSLSAIDVVHTHTWYVAMAGLLAKEALQHSLCPYYSQSRTSARLEGRAARQRLRHEFLDGAHCDPRRRRRDRRLPGHASRHPPRLP